MYYLYFPQTCLRSDKHKDKSEKATCKLRGVSDVFNESYHGDAINSMTSAKLCATKQFELIFFIVNVILYSITISH